MKKKIFIVIFMFLSLSNIIGDVKGCASTTAVNCYNYDAAQCVIVDRDAYYSEPETDACLIVKQNCGCDYLGYCYSSGNIGNVWPGGCDNNYAVCSNNFCPTLWAYDGASCQFGDWCHFNGVAADYHYIIKNGIWDMDEQQCIECDGNRQHRKIVDTMQSCYEVDNGEACKTYNPIWTEDITCSFIPHTCEAACPGYSGSLLCDELYSGDYTGQCSHDNVRREDYCDNNCNLVDGTCEADCGAFVECDEKWPGKVCRSCIPYPIQTCQDNCICPDCPSSCSSDSDCTEGYRCDVTNQCDICNRNGICENTINPKPGLQEISVARNKYPNAMIGVSSDIVYHMMRKGVVWKNETGHKYSNAYELFRDKGANWVRVVLWWSETQEFYSDDYYSLDYINKSLHLAKDAGFNIAVNLGFADGWGDMGPHCINLNPIILPKYSDLNCPDGCCRFDDLNEVNKKTVLKEYARNVSKFFEDEGIDVKIYEIGYEFGIPGFLRYAKADLIDGQWVCPHEYLHFEPGSMINDTNDCNEWQCKCCSDEDGNGKCDYDEVINVDEWIEWHYDNIWSRYEAGIIKDVSDEIRKSNPDALIQSHVDVGWQYREWVYNYTWTILKNDVGLNYSAISYYPSSDNREYFQSFNHLLWEIDWIHQKLLDDDYDIEFIIAEFGYPSSPDLSQWFLERNFDNEIESYSFTPEGYARWLRDLYDAINNDDNIIGSFLLWPEAANEFCNNFCSLFDYIPETYDLCPDCCDPDNTATYDSICHEECGADYRCDKKDPGTGLCDATCQYLKKEDIDGNGKVDIIDIAIAANAYGSYPSHPKWDHRCDINGDEKCDIKDIAGIAKEYGWIGDGELGLIPSPIFVVVIAIFILILIFGVFKFFAKRR